MLATPDLHVSFALNRRILDLYEEVVSVPLGHKREINRLAALLGVDTATAKRIYGREFVKRFMQPTRWTKALVHSVEAGKPAVLIAPPSIRLLAERHGFKIHRFKSSVFWVLFSFRCLVMGVAALARTLIQIVLDSFARTPVLDAYKGVYLDGLVPAAAHISKSTHQRFTFFAWSIRNANFFGGPLVFHSAFLPPQSHQTVDAQFAYAPRPYSFTFTYRRFIAALWEAVRQFFLAVYLALRGQVAHLMLFSQLVTVIMLKESNSPYFFHMFLTTVSSLNHRPLWTYDFEKGGGKLAIVHYSSNMQPFVLKEGSTNQNYSWKASDWPSHWVWDEAQGLNIEKKLVGDRTSVKVVGPVWFEDSEAELPLIPPNGVGVFDVKPRRPELVRYLLQETNIYRADSVINFYESCYEVLRKLNLTLIVKPKRHAPKVEDRVYRSFFSDFCQREGVLRLDSGISPFRLLPHCVAAISIPFSSPSSIAKFLGIPSFFYDPTKSLNLAAYAKSDIPLINDHENLERALKTALRTRGRYNRVC